MTVMLNEAALEALLVSPAGPVGRDLAIRGERVLRQARENASKIVRRSPGVVDDIELRISVDADGLRAEVGIEDRGRIARYLSEKAEREGQGGWLVPALEEAVE